MSITHPVGPGDPVAIRAADWNAALLAGREATAERFASGLGSVPAGGWRSVTLVHVRNDTGSTWPAGGVYRLGAAVVDPEAQTAAARRQPTFEGLVPTGPGDAFAVALEIARAGSFALCAVTGAAVALLEVVDAAHGYAAPAAQVQLRSGLFGPVRILHKGAGTGVMTALVLLNPSGPVDEVRVHVRGKTRVAAAGAVPAHWEYDCREVKKSAASGNVTWSEFTGGLTYTGVLEDQDRELVVDGTGGFVSQAYVLHADPSGKLWISCDQYAGRTATPADPQDSPPDPDGILPGLVSTQKQEFAGPKTLRDSFRVKTPAGGFLYVTGEDAGPSDGQQMTFSAADGAGVTFNATNFVGGVASAEVGVSGSRGSAGMLDGESMTIFSAGDTPVGGLVSMGVSGGSSAAMGVLKEGSVAGAVILRGSFLPSQNYYALEGNTYVYVGKTGSFQTFSADGKTTYSHFFHKGLYTGTNTTDTDDGYAGKLAAEPPIGDP